MPALLRRRRSTLLAFAFVALLPAACTKTAPPPTGAETAPAGSRVVNLAIWSNYITPELLAEFEKTRGIHVQVSNYSSNEELLAKLQAGASGYDVIVPSDYMIFAMIKLGLLRPLEMDQIPNAKSLDTKLLRKGYDPENKFSVPYDWGTTGIAVNRARYAGKVEGWKDLFDNPELAGKFTLLDDVREAVGAALKAQGLSLNSQRPEDLDKAKALLMRIRPKVKSFTSEPLMPLVNGETAASHAYSTDALQARAKSGGKVDYILPVEGGTLWVDNLAIPSTSAHPKEAQAFINFLMEAKSGLVTTTRIFVAPANRDVLPLLPPDLRSNPQLFPSEKLLAHCEMIQDLGEALARWDRLWTEVKTGP